MGNQDNLAALLARATDASDEPDPNVTPLPRSGKGTYIARLRAGFHIQVGADANDADSFIQGPCDVPINGKMAIAHMAKWESPNAVKEWLAREHPKLVAGKPWLAPRQGSRRPAADVPREAAMKLAGDTLARQLAAAEVEVQRLKGLTARGK